MTEFDTAPTYTRHKTYKRETAITMLLFLGGLFVWAIAGNDRALEVAQFLTLPVFAFAGGAFGMDALAEQFGK